ncbi:hypothetical protein F4818DRAFT_379727 [Hypoxylon cercidicola]|nr:hypothetical protein F4818DRAFT_379727 [Hypoxylon cercidicola]
MATATATANTPETDLEEGQSAFNKPRRISYVRDITFKIIPFCALCLILFSAGGILIATFAYDRPIPQQGTIVVSILLLIFLCLFCVGGGYLYIKKRYPPLIKGPNAPDRPPPDNDSFLSILRRILTTLTEIHKRLHNHKEPGTDNNPAELEGPQSRDSQPPRGHRTNGQPSNTTEKHASRNTSSRKPVPSPVPPDRSLRPRPAGPRSNPSRHSHVPSEPTIAERRETRGSLGSPDSIPSEWDTRTRQDLHTGGGGSYRDTVSPATPSYHPSVPAARMNGNSRTHHRTPADKAPGQKYHAYSPFAQYVSIPEYPYAPAFAREPRNRLYEKDLYTYYNPLKTLIHGFEAAKHRGEYGYYMKPNAWDRDPRTDSIPASSNAPRTRGFPFNDTDDIWTQGSSTLPSSKQSSAVLHSARGESVRTSASNKYRDERDAGVATAPLNRSKKRTFSWFDNHRMDREQPRSRKRRDYSPSQERTSVSKMSDRARTSSEKSVTRKDTLKYPTPLPSVENSSPPTEVLKVPPKTKPPRYRAPECTADDEADEWSSDLSSTRAYKAVTSAEEDEEKSSGVTRERQWQHAEDKCNKQLIEPVKKARLWGGRQDRSHRRGLSPNPPEVPSRSSSTRFHNRWSNEL